MGNNNGSLNVLSEEQQKQVSGGALGPAGQCEYIAHQISMLQKDLTGIERQGGVTVKDDGPTRHLLQTMEAEYQRLCVGGANA